MTQGSTLGTARQLQRFGLVIGLCAGLLATACDVSTHQAAVPTLTQSNVHHLEGITTVEQSTGAVEIQGMVAYLKDANSADPHVLFGSGGKLFDLQLDGSEPRLVSSSCGSPESVSHGGAWLACENDAGIALLSLDTASTTDIHQILSRQRDRVIGSPAWGPDDRHLAVMAQHEGVCSINVYFLQPPYATATLVALLSLGDIVTSTGQQPGCLASDLVWSADGNWLAFADLSGPRVLYALALSTLLPNSYDSGDVPMPAKALAVPAQDVLRIGTIAQGSRPAWSSQPHTLDYVTSDGRTISSVDVTTQVNREMFTQTVAYIFELSWTGDGRRLVFVLGQPDNFEIRPAPAQIYVLAT